MELLVILEKNITLEELEKQLNILEKKVIPNSEYQDIIKEYLKMRKPSKRLLSQIVDKIIINQNKEITIKYKIKDPTLLLKELSSKKA